MKKKMLAVLCMVFAINLSGIVSASAVSVTEENVVVNTTQNDFLNGNTFGAEDDVMQLSYYYSQMIEDYFKIQDKMRSIYGDAYVNSSLQYHYLTLADRYFLKYYVTDDIINLDYGITYLYDHFASVGNFQSYHVNYRIASNTQRSYIPSTFNKDQADTGEFMSYVGHLVNH